MNKFRQFQVILLITGVFTLLSPTPSGALEIHVRPVQTPNSACPAGKQCITLEELANKTASLLNNHETVSLIFLDGVHTTEGQDLVTSNIEVLTISGQNVSQGRDSIIEVNTISITNVSVLIVQDISFRRGSHLEVPDTDKKTIKKEPGSITVTAVNTIQLRRSSYLDIAFNGSVGHTPFDVNTTFTKLIVEDCMIENGSFSIKSKSTTMTFEGELRSIDVNGGRIFQLILAGAKLVVENFNIRKSQAGLLIQTDVPHSGIDLEVYNCSIKNNVNGMSIRLEGEGEANVVISNCSVSNNAIGISMYNAMKKVNVTLQHTNITKHDKNVGLVSYNPLSTGSHLLVLRDVTVANNNIVDSGFSPVLIYGPVKMTIDSCLFTDNTGFISTLSLSEVDGFFAGETKFLNNNGGFGGALHLSATTIWLSNTSTVVFKNNTADRFGGAIYIQEFGTNDLLNKIISPPARDDKCFYQLLRTPNATQGTMIFENNVAEGGGNDIFGAPLKDDCIVSEDRSTSNQVEKINFVFRNESLSKVSSNPRRVCLCDENGRPQCADIDYIYMNMSIITGEMFTISVVPVGVDFGTVTGVVHASKLNEDSKFQFGLGQETQDTTSKMCENLQYSIHSDNTQVTLILSINSATAAAHRLLLSDNRGVYDKQRLESAIDTYRRESKIEIELISAPIIIHVALLPCPLGFNLLGGPQYVCQCTDFLLNYVDSCNITNGTGTFYRSADIWVSYDFQNETNGTDSVLVSEECNTGNCNYYSAAVDLYDPDSQCEHNRRGLVCGGCLSNYSLALGSSRCIPCENNNHLVLLLVFIAAGVVLVLFIKLLDLTVSQGTVNGLIFYANVIWLHRAIFISGDNDDLDSNLVQLLQIVKVFIAWLNLDLGIETCFIEGLNGYGKAWLQFAFPMYLWFLVGGMIFFCRYSTRLTRLFGNNAVSVLATLFSLSYLKVLRNNISVIMYQSVYVYHQQSGKVDTIRVWIGDGNVPYFGLEHSLLALACLLSFVFLWVPYTALLLLVPLIRMSDKPFFRWVNRLNPFFDAYYGPFKSRHRYWVGMELLIGALLPSLASVSEEANLAAIIIVTAFLCILSTYVYRKWYNTLLQISFLFNLTVVATAFIATSDLKERAICVSVSILISFIIFLCIVGFHSHTALNNCFSCSKPTKTIKKPVKLVNTVKKNSHHTIELRETLLETCFA